MSSYPRPPTLRDDPHGYGLCFLISATLLVIMLGIGLALIFGGLMLVGTL